MGTCSGRCFYCSFDNYYPQIQDGIKLCTYENDEKVIARISVSTLLKRIEGKSRPEGVRIVEGRVVPGNTVRSGGLLIWQK